MNSKTITKAFKGKVVKEIALNPAWDNVRKSYYYDPKIIFTDGTLIGFFVQETDVGEYGVKPVSYVLDDVELPICENYCNVLTIHDQIATDGQSLLCRHCESGCDWCEHFLEMNQICGHCGREK